MYTYLANKADSDYVPLCSVSAEIEKPPITWSADDCVACFFGVVTFITLQDVPKQATII